MENKNPYGKFLKKSLLMGLGIAAFTLCMIYFSIKQTGAGDIINQVLGGSFWFIVIGFVVFLLLLIYLLQRWVLSSLKPKDIPNGLPATATVIRSYQGNMRVSIGGVNRRNDQHHPNWDVSAGRQFCREIRPEQ
jgi:membrane protein implicated in regulation of membrane protease activity